MRGGILNTKYQNKAPPGISINWNSPYSQNLVGCWFCNDGAGPGAYNLVTNVFDGVVGAVPEWTVGPDGLGRFFANSTNYFAGRASKDLGTKFTLIFIGTQYTYNSTFGCLGYDTGTTRHFQFRLANTNTWEFIRFNTSGGATTISGGTFVTPGRIAVTGRSVDNDVTIFKDGVQVGSGSISGTPSSLTKDINLGVGYSYSNGWYGIMSVVLAYNVGLSSQVISDLSRNPNLVLMSMPRCIIGSVAGGTTYYQTIAGSIPAQSGTNLFSIGKYLAGVYPASSGSVVKEIAVTRLGNIPAQTGTTTKQTNITPVGSMPSQSGSLGAIKTFLQTVTGIAGDITGTIVKSIGKLVDGNIPSQSGAILKNIATTFSGNIPSQSGTVSTGSEMTQAVDGVFGSITGAVNTMFAKTLVGVFGDMTGTAVKLIAISLGGIIPSAEGVTTKQININPVGNIPSQSGLLSSILNPIPAISEGLKFIGSRFKKLLR